MNLGVKVVSIAVEIGDNEISEQLLKTEQKLDNLVSSTALIM